MTIRENLNHGKQRSSRRRASISGLFSTRGSSTISTPSPSPPEERRASAFSS